MELQKFTEKVTKALYQYYDTKVKIETHNVYKNNGILLHGICALKEGKNIAPTVYLNEFFCRYQEGESLGSLVQEIICLMEKNQVKQNIDVGFFADYEKVKKSIVLRLIHRNKNEKLLENVPFQEFSDLAIVCHCQMLTEELGTGSILIHNHHLEVWGITKEKLFQDATENSPRIEPYCILKMGDMVRSILEDTVRDKLGDYEGNNREEKENILEETMEDMLREIEYHKVPMYVLTNVRRYYGAASMIYPGMMQKMADMLQDDFYILPSSIHEIIFLSKSEVIEATSLNKMIQEVNQSQVEEEEWLSDHAYLYQRETEELIPVID